MQHTEARLNVAAAKGDGDAAFRALTELLDVDYFKPPKPGPGMGDLFTELERCPLDADETVIGEHAARFADAVSALRDDKRGSSRSASEVEKLKAKAEKYLLSNRTDRATFIREILEDAPRRRSQKMGLETLSRALPLVTDARQKVTLLKKLVDVLPVLEHHPVVQRNVQRRGLLMLEKAMSGLAPNDRAEIVVHLMRSIRELSTRPSRRYTKNFPAVKSGLLGMTGVSGVIGMMSTTVGLAAGFGALAMASGGFFGGLAGAYALASYLGIEKQVQGTALYLLKRELAGLRKNWAHVDASHREPLVREFETLRRRWPELSGTRKRTFSLFFDDKYINPAQFPDEPGNALTEAARRHGQSARARLKWAVISRHRDFDAIAGPPVRTGSEDSVQIKSEVQALRNRVGRLRGQARAMGLTASDLPIDFIENIQSKSTAHLTWASTLSECFRRVAETAEYQNPGTRPAVLAEVVAMTDRLAVGDEEFVKKFVDRANAALSNCENNARAVLKALAEAVVYDKARLGEDEFRQPEALLRVARQAFVRFAIEQATAYYIKDRNITDRERDGRHFLRRGLEVEAGLVAEIALGPRLGLTDAIGDMDYKEKVRKVDRHALAQIEKSAREIIDSEDRFIGFLMEWQPLTDLIERDPEYAAALSERIGPDREAYTRIDESETATDEERMRAAEVVVQAEKQARADLLRTRVAEFLRRPAAFAHPRQRSMAPESVSEISEGAATPEWMNMLLELGGDEPGTAEEQRVAREVMQSQFAARDVSLPRITAAELPYALIDNEGGGDCLFLALGEPVAEVRAELRQAIQERPDDEPTQRMNAMGVAAALSQDPATAAHAPAFVAGLERVPNSVYGAMVATAGTYAGEDELTLYSGLARNRDRTIAVVDADGTLLKIRNGERSRVSIDSGGTADRQAVLDALLAEADVALYKTQNHWQRIDVRR